jgi:NADPH-dependent glutamate synthase beta subunit-like oxidoreductase/glutamate synthase domain-containing protein 3/ferredoxin
VEGASNDTVTVEGIDDNGQRVSSKDFEKLVQVAFEKSNDLVLNTYGQHNVGGRLINDKGPVNISISGPAGQRLGCMGRPGTSICCNGPASDDVGYLNIGAEITVKGHATNGVCNAMAQGKVMIKGSIGSRGLTMTKWNPDYTRPELWVLGSAGDTFAEFNCGGVAVVCGVDPKSENVLGYRPCVGMVGGWIFYRGETDGSFSDKNVKEIAPNDEQWQWLMDNMPTYLESIDNTDLLETLSVREEWKLLMSITPQERALMFSGPMPMQEFRKKVWDKGFGGGDPLRDLAPGLDRSPIGLIETDELRRKKPFWANQEASAPCAFYCPVHIPTIDRLRLLREGKLQEAYELVLDFTPFPASVCGAICPNLCMQNCSRQIVDESIDIAMLGRSALTTEIPPPKQSLGKKVAIIGGGPAGINAAYQLAKQGVEAHIFEKDEIIGGKLAQVIPWDRLPKATWDAEIEKFVNMPNVKVNFGVSMNRDKFAKLQKDYDYVVVAVGTHEPRTIPFPGHNKVIPALDFLKSAKSSSPVQTGKQVVIIGAGNVGCDVACEAYRLGAEQVTLVDIQKPLAFGAEKESAEALGATFQWPVFTKEVTDEGLVDNAGNLIPAQTVIISIGDVPALNFLPETIEVLKVGGASWLKTDKAGRTSDPKVFAVGDVERPGLATNALGAGKASAEAIIAEIKGEEWTPYEKSVISLQSLTLEHYCPEPIDLEKPDSEADRCLSCGTCRDCHLCETICPTNAISRRELKEIESYEYVSDNKKCIACGFCADTCPCGIWTMKTF